MSSAGYGIYNEGQLEPMPGRTLEETLEMQIMQVLGRPVTALVRSPASAWGWITAPS